MDEGPVKAPTVKKGCPMQTITTVGLDIAKSVFQVRELTPVARWSSGASSGVTSWRSSQKLPACLAGIEACASGLQFGEEQLRHSSIPSEIIAIPKCDTSPTFGLQRTFT
jgi:hypothetical protein